MRRLIVAHRLRLLLVVAVVAVALAGCGSSSTTGSRATTTTTAAPAGCALNSLGATRRCWDNNHARDPHPDPSLTGCPCYLPQAANSSLPVRYAALSDEGGVVSGFTAHFAAGTTRTQAETGLRDDVLPHDSEQVNTGTLTADGTSCVYVNYRSVLAGKAWSSPKIGNPSGMFSVTYFSGDGPYAATNVTEAAINPVEVKPGTGC